MKLFSSVIAIAMSLFLSITSAYAQEMGIVTGSPNTTYFEIAGNISELVRNQVGINLKVLPSEGSLQNVNDVRNRRGVQLGLVQSDVLAFLDAKPGDPVLRDIREGLRLVFPLYNEEVHLIASRNIRTFTDLSKARVSVGPEGSGTFLTSEILFSIYGIKPVQRVHLSDSEALSALKNGDIDAMINVIGAPVSLFQKGISTDDKIHLVNIENNDLSGTYIPATIRGGTYEWQKEDIKTIAVKSVLVSFNYRKEHCANIGRVASVVFKNIEWLRTNRHPKWKEVDLNATLPEWKPYDCVVSALEPGHTETATEDRNDPYDAIIEKLKNMHKDLK